MLTAAVDQEHVAGAQMGGDVGDEGRSAWAVDGGWANDGDGQAVFGKGAPDGGLGEALGAVVGKVGDAGGLVLVAWDGRVTVDVGGADVDEAAERGGEQAAASSCSVPRTLLSR